MRKISVIIIAILVSLSASAQTADPMGLSEYVVWETYSPTTGQYDPSSHTQQERRLTNHEVDMLRATGFINPDGSVKQDSGNDGAIAESLTSQIKRDPLKPAPINHKGSKLTKKGGDSLKHIPQEKPAIKKKPLPGHKDVAKQTKTKHKDHPQSKGTIKVRPTNFPDNPSRDEVVQMQQHIQHIERTVGKALDLSLSAYAVAELPQATEGRSGVSIGLSSADGKTGEAIGFSSNFGDMHEYTIKISLSHAGSQDAAGVGASYQW